MWYTDDYVITVLLYELSARCVKSSGSTFDTNNDRKTYVWSAFVGAISVAIGVSGPYSRQSHDEDLGILIRLCVYGSNPEKTTFFHSKVVPRATP